MMTNTTWTDWRGTPRSGEVVEQIDVQHPKYGRVIATLYIDHKLAIRDGVKDKFPQIRVEVTLVDKGQASERTVATVEEGRKGMDVLRAASKEMAR